jgi:hypothetical protein
VLPRNSLKRAIYIRKILQKLLSALVRYLFEIKCTFCKFPRKTFKNQSSLRQFHCRYRLRQPSFSYFFAKYKDKEEASKVKFVVVTLITLYGTNTIQEGFRGTCLCNGVRQTATPHKSSSAINFHKVEWLKLI